MPRRLPLLFALGLVPAYPAVMPDPLLARLSEEAETFLRIAPRTLSRETLSQRAAVAKRRFRPRIGKSALQADVYYQTRQVTSEYTYSTLREAPDSLHEFRQVLSVDGKPFSGAAKARTTLTLGLRSADDHIKKRLLEEFAAAGLIEPAVDFGSILLLFQRRRLADYRFGVSRTALLGAEPVLVRSYEQVRGDGAFSFFSGRELVAVPVQGEIWCRKADLLPMRIVLRAQQEQGRRDEATVDYAMSPHGVLLPTSVVHTGWAGDLLLVENRFRYAPFQRFAADAEIKFTEVPPQ